MVSLIREMKGTSIETSHLSRESQSELQNMISDELKDIEEKMQEIEYIDGYMATALGAHFLISPDRALVNLHYMSEGKHYEQLFPLEVFYNL